MYDQIRSLVTFIFALSMMYMLLDCEFKNKKKLFLLGLFGAFMLICDIFVIINFGYTYFMKLYPLIIQTPVVLIFIFISKFKVVKVLFIHFTTIAITTSLSLISFIISSFFGYNRELMDVICYLMYPPLLFIIFRYLRPSFLNMLRNAEKGWFGFCTIPVSYTVLIYMRSSYNLDTVALEPSSIFRSILLLVLTSSAYTLIFRFFKQAREQLSLQNEQQLLRTQIATAQIHLEDLKEAQEKTIIYRHDMRHHLNLISSLLSDHNTTATLKYIAEVQQSIDRTVIVQYCDNYTINLILSSYLNRAKNDQIAVETQIKLSENNKVSDMDLCVIFANAIENAINACLCISNADVRTIKIICKNKNDKLFIQITNSYEGTLEFVNDMPVTTEKNHGLGTKSIAAIARKYSGISSFSADCNVFTSVIIL